MIPVSRPSIGEEELKRVKNVFKTGWLGMGSEVFEFEEEVKRYLGIKNVIAVNSGTNALHLALESLGVKEGDEVIVPSLTFAASVQAIISSRAKPVFCEVNENDLNIDVNDVRKKISPRTKAIMPVHYCGKACDLDALLEIGGKNKVKIIEDAAHAFGSSYQGKKIGSFGDGACFSFDPIKNITTGEGGAVTVNDDEAAEKIRRKRILGIDKDTWHRYKNQRTWFYEVVEKGYRYHMSNINAAIGLAQLKKMDLFIGRKRKITIKYDKIFSALRGIKILANDHEQAAQFCYIIRVLNGKRDQLMSFLKEKGIGSGVHYIPNHLQPFFKKFRTKLAVTEKLGEEILTLPLFYDMSEDNVDQVINAVKEFVNAA